MLKIDFGPCSNSCKNGNAAVAEYFLGSLTSIYVFGVLALSLVVLTSYRTPIPTYLLRGSDRLKKQVQPRAVAPEALGGVAKDLGLSHKP